jgi:hypothetical protein
LIHPFDRELQRLFGRRRTLGAHGEDAISVAGRLGDHKEARIFDTAIEYLMRRLCRYGEAARWCELILFTIKFDYEFAREYVEKLRCALMQMTLLSGAGWHTLFDNAQAFGTMEVPAIACLSADGAWPRIVLGVNGSANNGHSDGPPANGRWEIDRVHERRNASSPLGLSFLKRAVALQTNAISLSLPVVRRRSISAA